MGTDRPAVPEAGAAAWQVALASRDPQRVASCLGRDGGCHLLRQCRFEMKPGTARGAACCGSSAARRFRGK